MKYTDAVFVICLLILFLATIELPEKLSLDPTLPSMLWVSSVELFQADLHYNRRRRMAGLTSAILCALVPLFLLRLFKRPSADKIMLGILIASTVLTILWYVAGTSTYVRGILHQGSLRIALGMAINCLFLAAMFGMYRGLRSTGHLLFRYGFVMLFSVWLFTAAFPWLGDRNNYRPVPVFFSFFSSPSQH